VNCPAARPSHNTNNGVLFLFGTPAGAKKIFGKMKEKKPGLAA
jgi:hypothetical protein